MKFICSICGYVHEGESAPEYCPNCNADREKFELININDIRLKMKYSEKVEELNSPKVNLLFGNYESLQPFIYNLPAGTMVPLHKHPTTDELFYIIEGRFKFKIGNTEIVAEKGDILQGKMNIPHTFENISDIHGVFLSVKGPKPVDTEIINKEE